MDPKAKFAGGIRSLATTLALLVVQARELSGCYDDRGYASGGANPIVDADVASQGVTAQQVADAVNLARQLLCLHDNQAVLQAAWGQLMNNLRTDV
jgi:hypothetical protein